MSRPPKYNVTSGSSFQCQNPTQVPGVSSVPSDPRSVSLPSSSQPPSQLGLTRAPSDCIRTTLATLLNEQTRELPGEVDTDDTSRGVAPPDEQRDEGPPAALSEVPTSDSSKDTVTPSGSSPRRQKSAQVPCLSSPSLDPLPASTSSRLNELQKLADGTLPYLPDSSNGSRGIVPYDEQQDAGPSTAPPKKKEKEKSSTPASLKHIVTPSNTSSVHQEPAQAPCLPSPRSNPQPASTPSSSQSPPSPILMRVSSDHILGTRTAPSSEPQESSGRVLPEAPCSGNESGEIASPDGQCAGPSAAPTRASRPPKYPVAPESSSLRQKGTQVPPFSAFASPDLDPPSHPVRTNRVVLPNEPKGPPGRVPPVLSYPGDENKGVTDHDEQHHGDLSNHIADFAESGAQGGSTNGVMREILRSVLCCCHQ